MGGAEVVAAWRYGGSDVHVSYPCTVIILHRALVAVVLCCCRSWCVGRVFQHAHVSWSASLVTTPAAAVHLSSHHHRCRWRCSFSGGVVGSRSCSCCAPHSHSSPARGRRMECRHAGHAIFSFRCPFQILIKHWLRKRRTALLSSSSLLVLLLASAAIIFCSKTKRETLELRFMLPLPRPRPSF